MFALVALASCDGCQRRTPAQAPDAGGIVDAAPPPFSLSVVARSLQLLTLTDVSDGGAFAHAGLFLHLIAKDGTVTRIGTPNDYAPLLPTKDEAIGGYGAQFSIVDGVSGTSKNPLLSVSFDRNLSYSWDGKKWGSASRPPIPRLVEDHPALPKELQWLDERSTKDKTVVLGMDVKDEGRVNVSAFLARDAATITPLAKVPIDASCSFLKSADEKVYVGCIGSQTGGQSLIVLRLDGDTWTTVVERSGLRVVVEPGVDSEGGIWDVDDRDSGMRFVRTNARGGEERVTIPAIPHLTKPFYDRVSFPVLSRDSRGEVTEEAWTRVTLSTPGTWNEPPIINEIHPRKSGDVLVVARTGDGGTALLRAGRGNVERTPVLIRSDVDEQNEVRNARGLVRWAGHCASIFIPLPTTVSADPPDGGGDAGAPLLGYLQARMDRIQAAIAKVRGGDIGISVVRGTFGTRSVAGIILVREDPAASEEKMEAAATALVEIVTPNAASPPDVTCSVPTLEEIVMRLVP